MADPGKHIHPGINAIESQDKLAKRNFRRSQPLHAGARRCTLILDGRRRVFSFFGGLNVPLETRDNLAKEAFLVLAFIQIGHLGARLRVQVRGGGRQRLSRDCRRTGGRRTLHTALGSKVSIAKARCRPRRQSCKCLDRKELAARRLVIFEMAQSPPHITAAGRVHVRNRGSVTAFLHDFGPNGLCKFARRAGECPL